MSGELWSSSVHCIRMQTNSNRVKCGWRSTYKYGQKYPDTCFLKKIFRKNDFREIQKSRITWNSWSERWNQKTLMRDLAGVLLHRGVGPNLEIFVKSLVQSHFWDLACRHRKRCKDRWAIAFCLPTREWKRVKRVRCQQQLLAQSNFAKIAKNRFLDSGIPQC